MAGRDIIEVLVFVIFAALAAASLGTLVLLYVRIRRINKAYTKVIWGFLGVYVLLGLLPSIFSLVISMSNLPRSIVELLEEPFFLARSAIPLLFAVWLV